MGSSFRLLLDGNPADDTLVAGLSSIEVEENLDMPGAIQLNLAVSTAAGGDLTFVNDSGLKAFANVAVVATPEGGDAQCIFDGYVLSHKLHLETGTTNSTLQVWGQDATWLMNMEEKTKEWVDVTDADVANAIFSDYGISAAAENTSDDSPSHTEDGHTLMQRASDIQFLRTLARRNGKLCWVACADQPGQRTGYFARPVLDGEPVATITLNDPEAPVVTALDFEWDATRPTQVKARQALFNDDAEDGVGVDTTDSGLAPLDERTLQDFAGEPVVVLLTAPVDDAGELTLRAQSLLIEAGWFLRCEGEADVGRLNAVLRVGTIVMINGAGSLHSGKYLVWSVRHTITGDSHKMKFTLVRNAIGPEPAGVGGLF
jgi:phage protein D